MAPDQNVPPAPRASPTACATEPDSISVIIINHNSGALLAGALASLAAQTRMPDEVIVIDNGSSDHSLERVAWDALPNLRLIRQAQNTGFAAASNRAARLARSRWLAMLNCDAAADPGWLAAMSAAAGRHPGVALFASAQTRMDDPATLDGAGDVLSVTGLAWRGGYGGATATLPQEGACFGACAAGAFLSRALFLRLGGFEESFFCYLEDLDFSYRARLAGEECVFVPTAQILHKGAACSPKRDAPLRLSARNRLLLLVRNTPGALALAIWPLILLGLGLSLLQGARHGHALAVLWGFGDALRRLGPALAQRRRIAPPFWPSATLLRGLSWNPLAVLWRHHKIRPRGAPQEQIKPALRSA